MLSVSLASFVPYTGNKKLTFCYLFPTFCENFAIGRLDKVQSKSQVSKSKRSVILQRQLIGFGAVGLFGNSGRE